MTQWRQHGRVVIACVAGVRRGRKGGKNEREKRVRVEDARKDAIVFFILPPIKHAKPTQLWDVWLSKLSNQNHAAYLMAKTVGANGFSYFLLLFRA